MRRILVALSPFLWFSCTLSGEGSNHSQPTSEGGSPNYSVFEEAQGNGVSSHTISSSAGPLPGARESANSPGIPARRAASLDGVAVEFGLPATPLYIGSFISVPIHILDSSLSFEEIEFVLPDGPKAGMLSLSRDERFDPATPTIILGAGAYPSEYTIEAYAYGRRVGSGTYTVTASFRKTKAGPSRWIAGSDWDASIGAAWGGGPFGPQNVAVLDTAGTRRVAIVLVDTASRRYSPDASVLYGIRDRWMKEAITGRPYNGVDHSAAAFFRENSLGNTGHRFDLTGEIFGPVQLEGDWDDYFTADSSRAWLPEPSFWSAAIAAADWEVDFEQFDSIVFVSQSAADDTAAWPCASLGEVGFKTQEGDILIGVVSMPSEWGLTNGRPLHATLAHELAHNLGLLDQYVHGGDIGEYDLMHTSFLLPHFATPHKMMLGWIPAASVVPYNFASDPTPVSDTIRLAPAELDGSANAPASVEIRIADGWNYYFEYRMPYPGQIGDRSIPPRVLGTDFVSYSNLGSLPVQRPALKRLPPNGDGPVLKAGQSYEETDYSDPTFPSMFRASVADITADEAIVDFKYDVNTRPDPSIRPWPASDEHRWQSPDIEVRNMRNLGHPEWFNVPWEGNPNDVVARVTNRGTIDAPQVRVNFHVKDFTISEAPEFLLGSDIQDVPANETVEFVTWWTPPGEGHYCVIVRIEPYVIPGTSVIELTGLNNVAQSNYSRFISRTASPSTREITRLAVGNPLEHPAFVSVIASQTNPLYRTYLEHSWLHLEAGESREILVMGEYVGQEALDDHDPLVFDRFRHLPNRISLKGIATAGPEGGRDSQIVLGGAEIEMVEGLATHFDGLTLKDFGKEIEISGRVVVKRRESPAPAGTILLTFDDGNGGRTNLSVPMNGGGFTAFVRDPDWKMVRAYYVPPSGTADATSDWYLRP